MFVVYVGLIISYWLFHLHVVTFPITCQQALTEAYFETCSFCLRNTTSEATTRVVFGSSVWIKAENRALPVGVEVYQLRANQLLILIWCYGLAHIT